jgi:glutamine synthetase
MHFMTQMSPMGLSLTCRQWLTGILTHARGFCAITNPTVNSYKGWFLDTKHRVTFHGLNTIVFSVMVRIPATRGKTNTDGNRSVDAASLILT